MDNMHTTRFLTRLDSWTPLRFFYHWVFGDEEINKLSNASRAYNDLQRNIVLVCFENRYANLGGLGLFIRYMLKYLAATGERVIFITPLYKNIPSMAQKVRDGSLQVAASNIRCSFGEFRGPATLHKEPAADVSTYYIDMPGFFTAQQHPYDYTDHNSLLEDSIAFSSAVPFVLRALGLTRNILIHAHDWETGLIALSSKQALLHGVLDSAKTVFTLHNAYDSVLSDSRLNYFLGKRAYGRTVLQMTIPFLDAPLTTVSQPFAQELLHDSMQRKVFVNHCGAYFSMNPPVGIENGVFEFERELFDKKIIRQASQGALKPLLERKKTIRENLVHILTATKNSAIKGGIVFDSRQSSIPVFFMSGRFDLMQKGFDVIFHAFRRLKRGSAKLVFSPSNQTHDTAFSFFTGCAEECKGDIVIWPFKIPRQEYQIFLAGSSFVIMPSFYEPFGSATEAFVHATPVIARATGGLITQVVSLEPFPLPTFYHSFFSQTDWKQQAPTGILYREKYQGENAESQWGLICSLPPERRMDSPLYQAMVNAAYDALEKALLIFKNSAQYENLIINGINSLKYFEWEPVIEKYRKVYNCVIRSAL